MRVMAYVKGVRLSVVHLDASRELMTATVTAATLRCALNEANDLRARLLVGSVQVRSLLLHAPLCATEA